MPNYLNHHIKLHHLHYTEINELYISLSLQAFSAGLVGIFVPIYLYTLGFSITQLALYFIFLALTRAVLQPTAAKLVMRYGPKHIIMTSYIILFCYMLMLYFLPANPQILYLAAIIGAVAENMFWMARHIDLATVTTNSNTTKEFSLLLIFSTFAQALAPLFGGLIASRFGMEYTLLGASIGLLVAVLPLLKTPEPVVPKKAEFNLLKTAPQKHMIASFAINAQGIIAALQWPLFIFLIVQTYKDVGIVSSASLLIVVMVLIYLSRLKNRDKSNKMLKTGSNLRAGVHTARTFTQSFPAAMGINILGDLTDTLVSVPYATRFYESARRYDIHAYLTDMEIAACLGQAASWIILLTLNAAFGLKTALIIAFLLAALLTPLLRLIEPLSQTEPN